MTSEIRVCIIAVILAILTVCSTAAYTQSAPLPLGTWTTPTTTTCPANMVAKSCYNTVISCPGTQDLRATFGYKIAANPVGTIVYLSGGGGTAVASGDYQFAVDYSGLNYTVVQMVWQYDWENTNLGNGGSLYPYSIKTAACRPATFLKLIYTSALRSAGIPFCAQGASAGSSALGYALAWYGAGSSNPTYPHLDNVELIDGPVFSDLKQGCAEFNNQDSPDVNVCGPGTSQKGCNGWGQGVTTTPEFIFGSQRAIQQWSGDPTCTVGPNTSSTSNAAWLAMSIVDGTTNPSFTYRRTSMAGWLCASVMNQNQNCDDNSDGRYCLNTTTAQGQIFFSKFTNPNQFRSISLNAVQNCGGPEGVNTGTAPNGLRGIPAVEADMQKYCTLK